MPGTIQVTVLEFKGISSSSDSSAISIKVSMGKRFYQTQDKGDFSFPIAKLSEDLAIAIVDEEGNEIANTGIRIMQIVQKGTWDDIFSFEGGGYAHLNLHFALNEEEKNRIRAMRESAMKKNLETTSNINLTLSESAGSTRNIEVTTTQSEQNVSDSQTSFMTEVVSCEGEASLANSPLSYDSSSVDSNSCYQKEEDSIQETERPNTADRCQDVSLVCFPRETETQSPHVHEDTPDEKIETALPALKVKDPDPKKTPTNSSVKKMISAFETGQLKVVKSPKRSTSILSEQNVVRKGSSLEDQGEKGSTQSTNQSLRKIEDARLTENLSQNQMDISGQEVSSDNEPFPNLEGAALVQPQQIVVIEDSLEDEDVNGVSQSTDQHSRVFEDAGCLNQTQPNVSGQGDLDSRDIEPSLAQQDLESRVDPVEPRVEESNRLPVDLTRQSVSENATNSGRKHEEESRVIGSENETGFEGSIAISIRETSDRKPELMDFEEEEYYSPKCSGAWIFPSNVGGLCITTAGSQVMKVVELRQTEAKIHQEKEVSLESEILDQQHEIQETDIGIMPESSSSPDDSYNKLIGQAVKVAVFLGFGVLVLLNRKKEPRKKKSGQSDVSFSMQDSISE